MTKSVYQSASVSAQSFSSLVTLFLWRDILSEPLWSLAVSSETGCDQQVAALLFTPPQISLCFCSRFFLFFLSSQHKEFVCLILLFQVCETFMPMILLLLCI